MPKIEIETGPLLFTIYSLDEWRMNPFNRHSDHDAISGNGIWVDAAGRLCPTGREMIRAHEEGTFPIRVYRQTEQP